MATDVREVILTALLDIEKNHTFSNVALLTALRSNQFMSKQDRAYITRMVEGVTERRITLDYIINQFSKTRINKCKPLIRCLLRMGTYEIFYMDSVKDYATCNECVKLAVSHGFRSLRGFVNGVLRNISRGKDGVKFPQRKDGAEIYYSVKYSILPELVTVLLRDYDENTVEKILESGESDRPTAIRVNTDKTDVDTFAAMLAGAGIHAERGTINDTSLLISGYDYIKRVPGYLEGLFVVQDQSSCLAVRAAGIKKGDLIVDVCAAPGGKTMYAASLAGPEGRVISRDISESKTELIEENIERLGIANVTVQAHDALCADEELFGRADVVIADLPCSGLGIMGRKNDIKYNVTGEGIEELARLQREILDVAARYVRPGGVLVYSTCTIDSTENRENAVWFEKSHGDFHFDGIDDILPGHGGEQGYMTLLQGVDECDGFFIAKFVKDAENKL